MIVSIGAISGAVIGAATSLFGLAKFTANAGDNARKTAQMLGLTTEALQELQFAASIGGVSQEEMTTALRQLSNSASDASMGLETYARTYRALGISTTTANGKLKNTDQILTELAEKFSKMPDGMQKTAYANDIFGRSGARLIPMLNQGSVGIAKLRAEAIALGVVIGEKDAAAAEEFNDSLTRLKASALGVRNMVGVGLIPVLTELILDMKEWVLANRDLIKSTLQDWIKRTIALIKSLYLFTKQVVETIKSLADGFGGLDKIIKAVTTTIGIFIGLKLVYSVGLMAKGIYGLAAAFTTMGTAAMWAQIKLLAIPLLIGGAIISLLLLLEDLWRFSQGDKSVFGIFVDAFTKKMPKAFSFIATTFMVINNFVVGLTNIIKGFALVWAGIMNFDLGAIIAGLKEVDRVFSEAFRRIGSTIKNAFLGAFDFITGTAAYKSLDWFIGKAINWLTWTSEPGGIQPFSSSPATAPVSSSSTVNSPSSNFSISAPISIQIPSGVSAEEVGSRVRDAVKDVFGEILRQNYVPNGQEW